MDEAGPHVYRMADSVIHLGRAADPESRGQGSRFFRLQLMILELELEGTKSP